jgi:hypothetical protein
MPSSPLLDHIESRDGSLETEITRTGADLYRGLSRVLESIPNTPRGPLNLARSLGVDKVLASRILKAVRSPDPMSVVYLMPGPDPIRRLLRGAARRGVDDGVIRQATDAVDRFADLIRNRVGDRSTLDTIVSAWVPEARREFELRRKQSMFKAMSQLKGAETRAIVATAFLHPSRESSRLDIVWVNALVGVRRLRPGAGVKLATRRISPEPETRKPRTLEGNVIDSYAAGLLAEFCSSPLPQLEVEQVGEATHYTLSDRGIDPRKGADLVFAEVNFSEMRRAVPRGSQRKGYVFAEVSLPAVRLQFDVFLHEDVYPGSDPKLLIYDTAIDGVADVNDPARNIDRLELQESIDALGKGFSAARSKDLAGYPELLRRVTERMTWDASRFRSYRCTIEYPLYGAQVVMAFDPPEE